MAEAKQILVKVIPSSMANAFVKKVHYSGKVVPNSQLHFGVFLGKFLHGVMSFGPSMVKDQMIGLVKGTEWNGFLELNRMAFDDALPKNSESRAIAVALRMLKKQAPHVKWIISFADGTQCGDGTIYRASGFVLTQINKNSGMRMDDKGNVYSRVTFTAHRPNEIKEFMKMRVLDGFMLRYIRLLDPKCELTVPVIPFSEIEKQGAKMYKGVRYSPTVSSEGTKTA
jgi:hypothetical protein